MKSEFYGTEIFLDNDTTQEYLDICRIALKRDTDEYHEVHMVIPQDFFRFLPSQKMPDDKKVYCKLTPEEHWRCHELLIDMSSVKTKQWSIAYSNFHRIQGTVEDAGNKESYGNKQRERNVNWKSYTDEIYKYHPELFDGTS